MTEQRRAQIVGTGLIGGSVGLALQAHGWHVTGCDREPAVEQLALARGAIDEVGLDTGWHEVGSLRLASSAERMEELRRQAGWAR